MTPEMALEQIAQGLRLALLLGAPLLLSVLVTGVVVGILQAATSINEPTVAFVFKVGALVLTLALMGHFLLGQLVSFTTQLFRQIPHLIG
jgi:flagellar biosynthetic protein FliQ